MCDSYKSLWKTDLEIATHDDVHDHLRRRDIDAEVDTAVVEELLTASSVHVTSTDEHRKDVVMAKAYRRIADVVDRGQVAEDDQDLLVILDEDLSGVGEIFFFL